MIAETMFIEGCGDHARCVTPTSAPLQDPECSPGKIVNLAQSDAGMLSPAVDAIHSLWIAPLTILVTVAIIWQMVGMATLAGVAAIAGTSIYVMRIRNKQMLEPEPH